MAGHFELHEEWNFRIVIEPGIGSIGAENAR
jgi:hypothetical protein